MEFSEQTKTYLSVCGIFGLIIYFIICLAKSPNLDCDERANDFKNDFSCNIILTQKENDAGMATLTGIDILTKKTNDYVDGSKWLIDNFEKFKIGDTVIKPKGQFTITVKSKNKTTKIFFRCGDKVYDD
jgi:hypothetical protein